MNTLERCLKKYRQGGEPPGDASPPDVHPNRHKVATVSGGALRLTYTDTGKVRTFYSNATRPQDTILENIQQSGASLKGKKFQFETTLLNEKQTAMYREAVYGLKAFTEKELAALPKFRQVNISARHKLAQKLINRWKQRTVALMVDGLISQRFPQSKLFRKMAEESDYYSDKDINPFSFKDLGISREMIVSKLMEWKMLPGDFYQLT